MPHAISQITPGIGTELKIHTIKITTKVLYKRFRSGNPPCELKRSLCHDLLVCTKKQGKNKCN